MRLRSTVILAAIAVLAVAGFLARDSLFGREEPTVVEIVFEKPVCTEFVIFFSPDLGETEFPHRIDIAADASPGAVFPDEANLTFQFFQTDGQELERVRFREKSIGTWANSSEVPTPDDVPRIAYSWMEIEDPSGCDVLRELDKGESSFGGYFRLLYDELRNGRL